MSGAFFDYPDQPETSLARDLIFLPEWDDAKWQKLLRHTEIRKFRAGDVVIKLGDNDSAFYIIVSGRLEVLIPEGRSHNLRRIQVIEAGAVVGEQAFLDRKPRSATLRAMIDGELVSISVEAFQVFAAHEPELSRDILFELGRTLSVKLRYAINTISNRVK